MTPRKFPRIDQKTFEAWFHTPFGATFIELEKRELCAVFPQFSGTSLLQVGMWGWDKDFLGAASLRHQWLLGLSNGPKAPAMSAASALPVPSRSMDAVIIPHGLEFVAQPRGLIAEVGRMLCERGQVVILGFNPLSLCGMKHWMPGYKNHFPWFGRPLSSIQVKVMLEKSDLQVVQVRRFGVRLPSLSGEDARRLTPRGLLAPLGGGYLVLARKRVIPLTPRAKPAKATPKLKPAMAQPAGTGCAARTARRKTADESRRTVAR